MRLDSMRSCTSPRYLPADSGPIDVSLAPSDKAKRLLGFEPKHSWRDHV